MKQAFRRHGLSLVTSALFLAFLIVQSISGMSEYNEEQLLHGEASISWLSYLATGAFGEATFENWESEFFQMFAYITLTKFLFELGSPESKSLSGSEDVDEDPMDHRRSTRAPKIVRYGNPTAIKLYAHSLGIAFFTLWLVTVFLHAWTGAHAYSAEQAAHGGEAVSMFGYFLTNRFWFESMQNYQSEFMVLAVLLVLTVYLRERGSPESKPVHASHTAN